MRQAPGPLQLLPHRWRPQLWHHGGAMAGRHQEEGDPARRTAQGHQAAQQLCLVRPAPSCRSLDSVRRPLPSPTPTCQSPPLCVRAGDW
uniref:Secreted protein n=1 Tax=Macrostomum lignano TaxID=282301 RepID=A0A1I8FJK0_9PLAT